MNSLQDWIVGCGKGDSQSFESLYKATSPKLFSILVRILKSKAYAEEVLQEGFMEIWKNSNRYDASKGKPFTWMSSIMRYRALDRLRQTKRDVTSMDDKWFENLQVQGPGPFEKMVSNKERSALIDCLQTLSADQKNCIASAFYDGQTHEEISEIQSKPLGTIKTWLRRGLEKLKSCLEGK